MDEPVLTHDEIRANMPAYRDFHKVLGYCKRWGVSVDIETPLLTLPVGYHQGPVAGAICWENRSILWGPITTVLSNYPHALLHELSHVLAADEPEDVDEIDSEMLAFEYHSSRFLHLKGWAAWMANYQLTGGLEWRETSSQQRGNYLQRSFQHAIQAHLLTRSGKPTFKNPFK